MGKVKKSAISLAYMTFDEQALCLKSWFDSFNSDLISTEIIPESEYVVVTIDNKMNLCMHPSTSSIGGEAKRGATINVGLTRVGDPISASDYNVTMDAKSGYGAFIFTICISNSVFYLTINGIHHHYAVDYEIIGNASYYGKYMWYRDWSSDSSTLLRQITLYNYDNLQTYSHTAILGYATVLGTIDYTPQDKISSASETRIDTNFLGCSTVTPYQVYTINGQNYYAVSENVLFLSNNSLES